MRTIGGQVLQRPIGRTNLFLAVSVAFGPLVATAAPLGGSVVGGTANIVQSGRVTTINQSSQKVAINWQGFSIGSGETVNFNQPGASAIALNRVVGNETSVINGALNANGSVFLINSNGVLFTKGASVNVSGLVASTLDLSDRDFLAGNYAFSGGKAGVGVVNQGQLSANAGGYIALLSQHVSNQGSIIATKGMVVLASGEKVSLNINDASLVGLSIEQGALDAMVENKEAIYADGGKVVLTAKAADSLLGSQVNNSGVIQARTLDDLKGGIVLDAVGGRLAVDGVLDASAPSGGDGGAIETSGTHVSVADSARVTTGARYGRTGRWLIDPDGFTIGSGGDMTGSLLGSLLASNNIVLLSTQGSGSDGGIKVNDSVSWAADTTLSLNATRDIDINAAISATGTNAGLRLDAGSDININAPVSLSGTHASLTMNYGDYAYTGSAASGSNYHINNLTAAADGSLTVSDASLTLSGSDASLSINGTSYTLIHSMAQLAALSAPVLDANGNIVLSGDTGYLEFTPAVGYFALAQDLNAGGTVYAYSVVNSLQGTLAGLGHKISHLTVSSTTANQYNQFENAALIGTFGANGDTTSQLRDLGLVDVHMTSGNGTTTGSTAAGMVATNFGAMNNVYVTGAIAGSQPVGGLVAFNMPGASITNAHADVTISALAAGSSVGGLVGENFGAIDHSSAKGSITVGGIDLHDGGGLTMSTGIGGLVGTNFGTVAYSDANVNISANNSWMVGGLVGENYLGTVDHSSASGAINVTWTNQLNFGQSYGGLVGDNNGGAISNSTASGSVTATATSPDGSGLPVTDIGGLVGTNQAYFDGTGGTITNSSASGNVTVNGAGWSIGGAVGNNAFGTLSGVTANGNVSGGSATQDVGGLVGNNSGTILNSSAHGDAKGGSNVGAFAGTNSGFIGQSSATGSVTALVSGGGLVGHNTDLGTITDSAYHDFKAERTEADREALATLQARIDAGIQAASLSVQDAQRPASPAQYIELDPSGAIGQPAPIADSITFTTPSNYSATIQQIKVDGQTFELEDDSASDKKPVTQ